MLLADYLPYAETLKIPARPPRVPACRDPSDIPFRLPTVVGKANFLAAGDQDLLRLARQILCPVVTAETFLENRLSDE